MLGTKLIDWNRTARNQDLPVHLILFVTDHCNAKCGTCFYWQNLNHGESLKPDHIENISSNLKELIWLDLSGGEPFLRKDIAWICQTFLDRNHPQNINIPTNALMTSEIDRSVREILKSKREFRLNIAISLDGIGENHDRVRGVPGNWNKAMATMEVLQKIREEDPRLSLSVVTTLMKHNVADVKRLLDMGVTDWKLDYHSLNILRGVWMDKTLEPPTVEQYEEVSKLQLDHSKRYFNGRWGASGGWMATLGRHLLNRYYLSELKGQPRDIVCGAGDKSCVIDANGDVYFCELLKKVGNLKDYGWDFRRLWNDFEAVTLRQRVNNGCHCTHECFHTKNLIFTPWRYL